jgi:hypothetical protein
MIVAMLDRELGRDLRKVGVDEEVQTTAEFLSDLEQISISSVKYLTIAVYYHQDSE